MTPSQLEQNTQKAAAWLFSADKSHSTPTEQLWITPPVLMDSNPDPSTLWFTLPEATIVVSELYHRGLLTPIYIPVTTTDSKPCSMSAYIINHTKVKEWEILISKRGWWQMTALPYIKWFLQSNTLPWLKAAAIFIVGAFITQLVTNCADDCYHYFIK